MSLTVRLKNIGILKQAEFSLGDLTIICGENNTGKTYASYTLYGFLKSWDQFFRFPISKAQIKQALSEQVRIKLTGAVDSMLSEACKKYTGQLHRIFAAPEDVFQNSEFQLVPDNFDIQGKKFSSIISSMDNPVFTFAKDKGSKEVVLTSRVSINEEIEVDTESVKSAIDYLIIKEIFSWIFPRTIILTSERTGVSIFRKELDYARSHLLDELILNDKKTGIHQYSSKAYQRYPLSITENIDFSRRLDDFTNNRSLIAREHPDVLEDLADIVGGKYVVTQLDQLYFIPKGTRRKLTMVESSGAVRSLLDLSFYFKHIAEKGDLLIVDEPELNLHPENQRRIARLFTRLVNLGVKVFITTHSDYIVKELNTLIMLNHDKPHLKRVAEENGYQESELIKADQVKVYVAETALMPLEKGQQKRRRAHTLVPADIDPEFGIEVDSFDKTINAMNKIQRNIVWGAKQDK